MDSQSQLHTANEAGYRCENAESARCLVLKAVQSFLQAPSDLHLNITVKLKPTILEKVSRIETQLEVIKPAEYGKKSEKKKEKKKEGGAKKNVGGAKSDVTQERGGVEPQKAKEHCIPTGEYYAVKAVSRGTTKETTVTSETSMSELGIKEKGEQDDPTCRDCTSLDTVTSSDKETVYSMKANTIDSAAVSIVPSESSSKKKNITLALGYEK